MNINIHDIDFIKNWSLTLYPSLCKCIISKYGSLKKGFRCIYYFYPKPPSPPKKVTKKVYLDLYLKIANSRYSLINSTAGIDIFCWG